MKRFRGLCLGLVVLVGSVNSPAYASGLPLVLNTTVNSSSGTLTINGQNFGSDPVVTLNNVSFPTVRATSNQIVANFPSAQPASSFSPGTYFLLVTYQHQLPSIFEVAIGANGPQGPMGVQGLKGDTGPTGATGSAGIPGVTGAMGMPGPIGATGSPGAPGAPGSNGSNGTGAPLCAASDSVVSYQGVLVCKSTLPHYVDNGDGTVTDNTTGLMWEKKSAGTGDVHDVNNFYTWNDSTIDSIYGPSGTLYSSFLQQLNGLNITFTGTSEGIPCFAGHCDWRIPEVGELRSILSAPYPTCTSAPCIDPAFGPTAAYCWSSSSLPGRPDSAWLVSFLNGTVQQNGKTGAYNPRAVRGGR